MGKARRLGKELVGRIGTSNLERARSHALWRDSKGLVLGAIKCQGREEVWEHLAADVGGDQPVLYLEFGVFEGYSMEYFAGRFTDARSRLIGFDSFEGLPEDWGSLGKGTFSTSGAMPISADPRISFVKGWFQDTLPGFIAGELAALQSGRKVVVHYDADIYSSTLFVLASLWPHLQAYHFCFDEFMGDELRALSDFRSAFPTDIAYLAYDQCEGYPVRVAGRMMNRSLRSRLDGRVP